MWQSMAYLRLATVSAALLACSPLAADTLLIGNKGENTVSFVDLESGQERARVSTGSAPHEIAISPNGKQAAVVAYGGTTLDIFDVRKAALVKRIVAGNVVIDHEHVTRTFPEGTGKIELVAIYEIQDGKIARAWFILGAKTLDA